MASANVVAIEWRDDGFFVRDELMDRSITLTQPVVPIVFHLPSARTPIIGRDEIRAHLADLVRQGDRLVTLVGPGGVGKTRLALAAAEALRAEFDGRVGWVSLGELSDPELLLDAVVRTLGVAAPGLDPIDALVAALGNDPTLLVIDNMEHLAHASGALDTLLERVPTLSLLVTSRVPLRLIGEREVHIYPFPPLTGARTSDALASHPAIRLFVQRAQAVESRFQPDDADLEQIAAIVARLDFLPLAIELAAARVRHFSLDEIAQLLSSRLELLTGGPRNAPDRQQTIRGTIRWSYELLRPEEQRLFRALSVFPGSFTLESAVQLAGGLGVGRLETIELLSALVDQNLLARLDEPGARRYAMLDSMRDFGQAQLIADGEDADVRSHFVDAVIARIVPPEIPHHEFDMDWLGLIERSMDDIRAAITWTIANEDSARALRIATDLRAWWATRGNPHEGQRIFAAALAGSPELPPSLRLYSMLDFVWLLAVTGEIPRAQAMQAEITQLTQEVGEPLATIRTEQYWGAVASIAGDTEEARVRSQRVIELAEEAGRLELVLGPLANMACMAEIDGAYEEALAYHQRILGLLEPHGRRWIFHTMQQMSLARVNLHLGNPREADEIVRANWAEVREVRNHEDIAGVLVVKAWVFLESGDPGRAARLFGAAEAFIAAVGVVQTEPELSNFTDLHERLSALLPAPDLVDELALGSAMTLEELGAEIECEVRSAEPGPDAAPPEPSLLTPREIEVAQLLVEGKTNPEIASDLFISERTVQSHVANIMAKLGVNSRAAVAARVVRDGLLPA